MLNLYACLAAEGVFHKKAARQQRIDAPVYELHGLTPEEIAVVEGM